MREFIRPNRGNQNYQNLPHPRPILRGEGAVNKNFLSSQEKMSRRATDEVNGGFFRFIGKLFNSKRKLIFWAIIIALGATAYFIWGRGGKKETAVYEAMVNVVDQKTNDPVEDARSSLKKNDVIAVFPEGHSWSDTEKFSYLIVKIKMTADDMAKLTQAKTKEVKREKGDERGVNGEKGVNGETPEDMGPQMETVLARQYYLNLPDYDVKKFWSQQKQPFEGKVFSDSIIKKK
jgi:hypothetical protein